MFLVIIALLEQFNRKLMDDVFRKIIIKIILVYLRCVVDAVFDTVVFELPEQLNSQNSIQGHEEQEEDRHVVDLLV